MILLIDIGASHIKYACVKEDKLEYIDEVLYPSSDNIKEIRNTFDHIYNNLSFIPDSIFMSSQMHGFYFDGYVNYVSWKNEECDIFELDKYTGIKPTRGIPIFNVNETKGMLKTLSDIFLDDDYGIVHDTIFCGTGYYDIVNKKVINTYDDLQFKKVVGGIPVLAGKYKNSHVYACIGDLQASIYSIPLNEHSDIVFNLGTGSQIVRVSDKFCNETENRNFFNNKYLNCITHIPSGRALNVILEIVNSSFSELEKVTLDDVTNSTVTINLNLFQSAYNFNGTGGSISNIFTNTTRSNLLSSIVRSYCDQYIDLSRTFEPFDKIWITGGIPKKLNVIVDYIKIKTGKKVELYENDTLLGLFKIVKEMKLI